MSQTRLISDRHGVRTYMTIDGDKTTITKKQKLDDIFETNKALANMTGKTIRDDVMNHVASIPSGIMYKWLIEEGWNAWETSNPDVQKKLKEKLNSNEYRYLRTSEIIL